MLISLNWINEYIDIKGKDIQELENALTMIGQEVEKIERKFEHLDKVITAKIVEYKKHEDSDHLTVCLVDTGKEKLQIVCGAPNHKLGDVVCLATIGAKLGEDFVIKKGKIRGYESNGMLCSMKELGLGDESDGIIILPQDTKLGVKLNEYFEKDDVVFELEITPNRPDCLSYIGIARELAAYYNKELKLPEVSINTEDLDLDLSINIKDKSLAKRYFARVIKDVTVKESPKWLKDKLESVGMKSVNNIVDASNFVMLELGQPNHIFDLDKISNEITVDYAKENEDFVTLDGKEIKLSSEDIVIRSKDKAVCLAGVMGSLNESVTNETKNILLECASFDAISVRKTSRRHTIFTESSYRFERWVDETKLDYVSERLAQVIMLVAGGKAVTKTVDVYFKDEEKENVILNLDRARRFIGKDIKKEEIVNILKNLEIEVTDLEDELSLKAPSFRTDLNLEQDYYEEIIRMYGFDNIENILPKLDIKKETVLDNTKLNYDIKILCASLGLKEVINYSFIPKKALELIKYENEGIIEIENPITEDFAIMRPTLMYSLLKNAVDNYNRSFSHINFFELSKTFVNDEEITKLGVILSGVSKKTIYEKEKAYDYYDMKGIVESILEKLNISQYTLFRTENESFHPGRAADIYIGKAYIGSFGKIHPDLDENFDIEGRETMYFELNVDEVKKYMKNNIKYKPLSKYQSVTRDLAFVVHENVLVGNIIKQVSKIDKLIKEVNLFDVYQGPGVEEKHKSFAISLLMVDDNKTLLEKEINDVIDKIIKKLEKDFGAQIRK